MFLRHRISLLSVSLALALLAGCASSNQAVPPASGSFNNSNLSGTYVFSFSGEDINNSNESFFTILGTLTANGSGGFTAGTVDIADPALGASLQTGYTFNHVATSGTYNITSDGRGSGTITATLNGTQVDFGLDFVLTSGSHGMITRFDTSGSGSGTIDLQASDVAQSALQGSYAFALSGADSTVVNPLATVGSLTLDGNGNVTSGSQDFSDNGNSIGLRGLAVQGTVLQGSPGSSQLTTNAGAFNTLHFDVFVVDPTHLKFIETDATAYLEGDAFQSTGQTVFPSGSLVFSLGGEDTEGAPFASGGLLTSDGSSRITGGLEDVNDNGYVEQAPSVQGSFIANGARTVLTLNGLYNGSISGNTIAAAAYTFAAYPYNGGALLLEIDNGASSSTGISGGNLYVQSATTLPPSQGYGLNLSGANRNGEADWISEFTATGSNMTGLYDANNFGYLGSNLSLGTGTYSAASNGRGTASFPALQTNGNSFIGALDLTFYVVDSSTAVFIETDGNQVATGLFQQQTSTASSVQTPSFMRPTAKGGAVSHFRQ